MKLRPYQREAMTQARAAFAAGAGSVLVVAPTGSGKTVLAAACARSALDRGGRALVIVPRREIVHQTVAKLEAVGLDPSIVAAGLDRQHDPRLTVCMAQTMVRRSADCVQPPTLVIVDEAHTCTLAGGVGRSKQARFELIQKVAADAARHLILVTATPHSGNEDAFRSLLSLINTEFADLPHDMESDARSETRIKLAQHLVQMYRNGRAMQPIYCIDRDGHRQPAPEICAERALALAKLAIDNTITYQQKERRK